MPGRRLALLAFVLLFPLAATAAFADEGEAGEGSPGVTEFFEGLRRALAGEGDGDPTAFVDLPGLQEEIDGMGLLEGLGRAERVGLALGLRIGLQGALQDEGLFDPYARFRIRGVTRLDGPRLQVDVWHFDDEDFATKMRWWLIRRDEGWRAYDWEDLDLGMRFSMILGTGIRGALAADGAGPSWMAHTDALNQAGLAVQAEDWVEAVALLEPLRDVDWPPAFAAVVDVMLASAYVGTERAEEALSRLDRAAALRPDLPVADLLRAAAQNLLGRHDEALAAADAYLARFDGDAVGLLNRGAALEALARTEEAREAYATGLRAAPRDLDLLASLLRLTPPDEKAGVAAHLSRHADVVLAHAVLAEDALWNEDVRGLAALVETLRATHPEHPDVDYYGAHVHRLEGRPQEAAAGFRRGWPKVEDEAERAIFADWFLTCMQEAGRGDEAWAVVPDPAAAFERYAVALAWEGDDDALERLAASAERHPAPEAARAFVQAELAFRAARYAEAEPLLAAAHAALETSAPAFLDGEQTYAHWDLLWVVEDRLVRGRVRLGRAGDALEIARRIHYRDDDPDYVLIVHVARGEVDAATRLVRAEHGLEKDLAYLVEDEDLAPRLAEERFAALRALLAGE